MLSNLLTMLTFWREIAIAHRRIWRKLQNFTEQFWIPYYGTGDYLNETSIWIYTTKITIKVSIMDTMCMLATRRTFVNLMILICKVILLRIVAAELHFSKPIYIIYVKPYNLHRSWTYKAESSNSNFKIVNGCAELYDENDTNI